MKTPNGKQNVMLTYRGKVYVPDKYYGKWEEQVVTRRAIYYKTDGYYNIKDEWIETLDGYFSVPTSWKIQTWSDGTASLMPEGFSIHARVPLEDAIKWEPIKEEIE